MDAFVVQDARLVNSKENCICVFNALGLFPTFELTLRDWPALALAVGGRGGEAYLRDQAGPVCSQGLQVFLFGSFCFPFIHLLKDHN